MTVYVYGDPLTKKQFKQLWQDGLIVHTGDLFSAGNWPDEIKQNGRMAVSGPQYPRPHTWYAEVETRDGKIVRIK